MIKPLKDNVVLQIIKKENKIGNIILSTKQEDKSDTAKVIAVGPGKEIDGKLAKPEVKVGDVVVFKKYATTEVKENDEEFHIISSEDILAVIE